MKKLMALLMALILVFGVVGCSGGDVLPTDTKTETEDEKAEDTKEESTEGSSTETTEEVKVIELADELKVQIALGNNNRTITYNQATPLTLPDGTVVVQGDLKPTWQYMEERLGFTISDMTVQDQKASEMIDIAAALSFSDSTVYGGSGIAEKLMSYGAQGYFINLLDYSSYMPNFSEYLAENPNIAKAITAYDGGIYHVPYAAEIDNYARVFNGRETWVTLLLDGDMASLEAETASLDTQYEGYWSRQASNVVDLQNEAAGGTLTRDVALETLLNYIAETYPDLSKPSDLYLNDTAKYDIDELVALWRVIKLSPNTLSKAASGNVVDGAVITPFFARKASYREDIFRLANYFGGQRVYGSDSYGARFYLDANGDLQFSYAEEGFIDALSNLRDIFAEGLIFSEFSDLSNKDDFRKALYTKDTEEGHQQFGFMTFDWIASTTASNPDVVSMLPPLTTVDSDEFIYYVENTRVIKPDGWSISANSSDEEIAAALTLFDYIFSEEGHVLQNYGIPSNLEDGQVFVSSTGVEYPKFNQWLLDTATEMKNGDVSGFLRDFMGSHIPIGYQKEIGFELQYTKNRGWDGWALYTGVDVKSTSYGSDDPLFRLVPPVFSLTEQDTAKLGTIAVGEDQVDQLFLYLTNASGSLQTQDELIQMYSDAGVDQYVEVYRSAYKRMAGE